MWTVRTKDRAWKANQNWLLGEHGASLFLRLSHMAKDRQTRQIDRQDRQTQGRMRVIVMLCQNDSFDLLSFSPQPLTEGLCHLDEFRPTNKLKCPLLQLYSLTPCLPASPLVSPLVCLSVSLHLLLSVCWSNSNKSVPPHSLLLQLVIHPSLLNVLLCLTKRRRQTSWSCDMNTFSHQIPSRLNIIRWLIDHLSFLFFNCQYKVFFPPLRVSFKDRSMTWNPAWGYGTVLFSSNESGQISAALLDCLPEFSQCQFLDFFSAYSLSSVCYQHLALQLSKGNEMVTQCSAYS